MDLRNTHARRNGLLQSSAETPTGFGVLPKAPACSMENTTPRQTRDTTQKTPGVVAAAGTPVVRSAYSPMACPVDGCPLAFPGKDPDRSIQRHLRYWVGKVTGGLDGKQLIMYEAHKTEYRRRAAERATSDQKKRAAQKKYRENNKEKRSLSKKVATLRRRLREKGMSLEAIEGAVRTITGDKPIGDAGYFSEKKELS